MRYQPGASCIKLLRWLVIVRIHLNFSKLPILETTVKCFLADLTVSKRPGTSYRIEIHFAVVNHLYLLFSLAKLVET